jgi:hypothetical protein
MDERKTNKNHASGNAWPNRKPNNLTNSNFLGLVIEGDITRGSSRKEQKPIEELTPLFEAVFAEDIIDGVRWTQYTPYFNDGDTCEFGANEIDVHFANELPSEPLSVVAKVQKALDENRSAVEIVSIVENFDEDEDDEKEYETDWDDHDNWTDGGANYDNRFEKEVGVFRYSQLVGESVLNSNAPHPQTANAVKELSNAISDGEFDNVLLELFGDHAQVQVVRGKAIHVEGYSHE